VKVSPKIVLIVFMVLVGVALVVVSLQFQRSNAAEVEVEVLQRRDLEAVVSASGKIQPKLSVDISASMVGKVTKLAVEEGDRVAAGQFLLEIDPESVRSAVDRGEAALQAAMSAQQQARVEVESARVNLGRTRETLKRQEELWALGLIPRDDYDRAIKDVELRETELKAREIEVETHGQRVRQERASLESARYDFSKVTLTSPISGIITRRTIEEGETVVVGTMNNQGTVLMTVADLSVIEAEVEVDETDIPSVQIGQPARVTIDALPARTFTGPVTEIGNSPIQSATQSGTASGGAPQAQATNFKVVVTLDGEVPGVRPGFTCTADITTATRTAAVAVPIQAATTREVLLDAEDRMVPGSTAGAAEAGSLEPRVSAAEPGHHWEEVEGVFVVRQGRAQFVRVTTGIAGDRYFEAESGVRDGDSVIIGPFNVVRNLKDGDPVRVVEHATNP
jgi:HlyD family secretion protein